MPNWCYNKITFPTKEAYLDFIERYGKGSRKQRILGRTRKLRGSTGTSGTATNGAASGMRASTAKTALTTDNFRFFSIRRGASREKSMRKWQNSASTFRTFGQSRAIKPLAAAKARTAS